MGNQREFAWKAHGKLRPISPFIVAGSNRLALPTKGPDVVIDAFQTILQRDVQFALIGASSLRPTMANTLLLRISVQACGDILLADAHVCAAIWHLAGASLRGVASGRGGGRAT
jgi:hypothetical protein